MVLVCYADLEENKLSSFCTSITLLFCLKTAQLVLPHPVYQMNFKKEIHFHAIIAMCSTITKSILSIIYHFQWCNQIFPDLVALGPQNFSSAALQDVSDRCAAVAQKLVLLV
jgi:hypothetical protein